MYTEWYPSRGYPFNITNSTSYDQYFVYGRTVFAVMQTLTDELFDTYLRRSGSKEPYYAEYCDGKSVTCAGMKQWGTVTLANQGLSALQILRRYYGNSIETVTTNNIQDIPSSYPGSPLRVGSTGTNVAILQRQLNRITQDYPSFGKLTVDSAFGTAMENTVKRFQTQFGLTADGVVGRSTWNKISYIYVSVKQLAQLTSEGEVLDGAVSGGSWGGTALSVGSSGTAVQQLQFWLDALAQVDASLPALTVDGRFGAATRNAVLAFQRGQNLAADGIVGQATWNALYAAYTSLENDAQGGVGVYPGTPLRAGSTGNGVRQVQFWLRIAAATYTALLPVAVDGSYGTATQSAVTRFQEYFSLTADGVVGPTTWAKLRQVYTAAANNLLAPNQRPGEYPGVLRQGSTGTAVRELQYYLYLLGAYYSAVPQPSIDGSFGTATRNSVVAWQRTAGLTADGVVGQATWESLVNASAALAGSGAVATLRQTDWPGKTLTDGDSGSDVEALTEMLALVAYWQPTVQSSGITTGYTSAVADDVRSFQQTAGLPPTGRTDEATWNALQGEYVTLSAGGTSAADPTAYPGTALTLNSTGPAVLQVQQWLNEIARLYCLQIFVPEDGVFGQDTLAALLSFQDMTGTTPEGVVDETTWERLEAYAAGPA